MGRKKVRTFKPLAGDLKPLADTPPADVHLVTCLWELGVGKYGREWKFRDAIPLDRDGQFILRSDADRVVYDGRDGGDCSWWVYGRDAYDGDDDDVSYRVPDGVFRAVTMWEMAGGVTLRHVTPSGNGPAYNSQNALMLAAWRHFVPRWFELTDCTVVVVRYLFGWETAERLKALCR